MATLLINHGADVNQRGSTRHAPASDFLYNKVRDHEMYATPLQLAIERGNIVIVRELLSHKANPNNGYHCLSKPLFQAIQKRSRQLMTLLFQHRADPNIRDGGLERMMPLNLVLGQYKDGDRWMVDLLLAKGATNSYFSHLQIAHDRPRPTGKEYAKVIAMLRERLRFRPEEETRR